MSVLAGVGVALGVLVASGMAALAAISNSPIAVGLVAGLLMGALLLSVPRVALWACVIGALLVSGFISLFFPFLNKATWLFSMLGFFLAVAALIQLIASPKLRADTPGFLWVGLIFIVFALATAPLAGSSALELLAGAKRYLQFWGLMFAGAWLLKSIVDYERIVRFLMVLALLQLPLALYQRIALVPLREGLGRGVVPIDVVSGTFEASLLAGGNSSAMVLFLTIALAFVLSAWREQQLSGFKCALLSALLVLPMGLGETKVVVVLLPLMLLVVFGRYVRRAPMASLLILLTGLACTALLFWLYGSYFGKTGLTLAQRLQATIEYNFGDVGYYGSFSLNRTTALKYWWANHGAANPLELFFGHGLGTSYAAPTSLVQGHVARQHGFIAIGFTAASSILWDLGLIGLVLLLVMLAMAWRTAGRLLASAPSGWARSAIVAARVSVLLFAVMLFYTDSVLNALSVQALLMICLGGVAAAARHWPTPDRPAARLVPARLRTPA
ncbi:MAG: hypothetical protein Q8N44_21865 [Rubrivivax sp.]|nr:hypothetical protein [Rubrivivax sp.]